MMKESISEEVVKLRMGCTEIESRSVHVLIRKLEDEMQCKRNTEEGVRCKRTL